MKRKFLPFSKNGCLSGIFSRLNPKSGRGIYTGLTMLICYSLLTTKPFAQFKNISPELASQLSGQTRLDDIMQTVTDYYKGEGFSLSNIPDNTKGNPMVKWARWALSNANRLDENGNITDYSSRNFLELMKDRSSSGMDETGNTETMSNVGSWSFIGPNNTSYGSTPQNFLGLGRVDRIAFHPTDDQTIYVGTPAGGLWRTTNNGTSWTMLTKYLPSPGISGVVVNSSNPNILYILTGDGDSNIGGGLVNNMGYVRRTVGVLKSTDGGSTWDLTGELPSITATTVGYKLVQSPTNTNLLIAATSSGLYRTTDGGANWVRERTGRFWDVRFRHNSGTTVYATGDGADRFVRSTNSGADWSATVTYSPATPTSTGRGQLAVSNSATAVVYVLWGPVTGNGVFKGLYKSVDAGVTFTRQTTTPNILGNADDGSDNSDQSSYDLAIAVRPTNSTHIFTAGTTVWKSTNSGSTMTKSTSFRESGAFAYIHPDVHDLAYHPTSGWLYAATDGGMYRSNDQGLTWVDISPGINTTQFYRGNGFNGNSSLFIGGAQDNGVLLRPSATSNYRFVLCCDGFDARFYPDDATRGYTSMNTNVFRFNNFNGGATNIHPSVNGKWFANLATHPTDGTMLYVGADSFHRSNTSGNSYQVQLALNTGWALTSCPSNVNRLYAAGGTSQWGGTGNIRRSDNQGSNWTTINGTTFAPTNQKVTSIGVDPSNSANVWATIGGFTAANKVFRTTNGTASPPTWVNVTGGLPNVPVNCVAVDSDNNAYIGTDIGVYYRGTGMTNWVPFYNFLPRVPVTSLILNEAAGVIKAVTFGFGVWQSPVYSNCPASLTTPSSITGYKLYEAGTTLNSAAIVFGGTNTEVFLKSGNQVILTPGFEARSENNFTKVYIGPCGNGIPNPNESQNNEPDTLNYKKYLTSFPNGAITKTPGNFGGPLEINLPSDGLYSIQLVDADGQAINSILAPTRFTPGNHLIPIGQIPDNAAARSLRIQLWKDGLLADTKEW